ncbi:hypothetical protein [Pseudomonas sp. NBRC 111138]|uniref:hypothetical protein n=1 Tax=Pseudomonas sp. NBRC 111138 TaxID=1661053 RepID=UPI0006D3B46C|nr:hypothetical protein [Pseudomonas sp. NBRC 111138]
MLTDNVAHRALFTLPPVRVSAETTPVVQSLPPQRSITGDSEVDAVLWLREVIKTGQAGPIATALSAAKKIKTPLSDVEKRYTQILRQANPGNPFATFASIGFTELESLAERSVEEHRRRGETAARFDGETIWENTPAEAFCEKALKRCKGFKSYIDNDKAEVEKRFRRYGHLMPHTLADCLHELGYWDHLYKLRNAVGDRGDGMHEAIAREWFVEGLLAVIPPVSQAEALSVLAYARTADGIDQDKLIAIAENLVGGHAVAAPGNANFQLEACQ